MLVQIEMSIKRDGEFVIIVKMNDIFLRMVLLESQKSKHDILSDIICRLYWPLLTTDIQKCL